jgi:uncharacterized cysteine cluster protein YcgN (CxxCxxCC family)
MPDSCAYRIVSQGGDLPSWHPLVGGDPAGPKRAGATVAGRVFPEESVEEEDMIDHITKW